GFSIAELFPFLCTENRPDAEAQSMSALQEQMGFYLAKNKPDLMLVFGDRFELLPVVTTCLVMNIPVAHISGGDVTEGAIDNQIRHSITKMAHLHFPATEIYKQNLMKMGEEEWRICVAGEPGLDQIANLNYISKDELFDELKLDKNLPLLLCTFHPETIDNTITPEFIRDLFQGLISQKKYQVLVTASNFDQGGTQINNVLEAIAGSSAFGFRYVKSLGQRKYYSLLKHTALLLGNSSSGITEAQSFNVPALNIGKRQFGRLANKNVYYADTDINQLFKAIEFAISEDFKSSYFNMPNIYGDGNSTDRIIQFLKSIPSEKNLLMKKSIF
ncbi:MAG: UDP-N-acetylglucosamine 2-epimerase, partial [Bacteroidia bacterium]